MAHPFYPISDYVYPRFGDISIFKLNQSITYSCLNLIYMRISFNFVDIIRPTCLPINVIFLKAEGRAKSFITPMKRLFRGNRW